MGLTGREIKMHRQAVGIHDGVNLTLQCVSRSTNCSALAAKQARASAHAAEKYGSSAPPRHESLSLIPLASLKHCGAGLRPDHPITGPSFGFKR